VGSRASLDAMEKRKSISGIEHEFFGLSARRPTEPAAYEVLIDNPIYKKIHLPVESAIIKIYEGASVNRSRIEVKQL
jgi:hypothetical protein